jgi:hypothetical protein
VREKLLTLRVPRTHVDGKTIASLALAQSPVNKIGKVLGVNILQQLFLVPTAQNLYLLLSLLVNPHLHDGPNASKQKRSVDDKHTSLTQNYLPRISG